MRNDATFELRTAIHDIKFLHSPLLLVVGINSRDHLITRSDFGPKIIAINLSATNQLFI